MSIVNERIKKIIISDYERLRSFQTITYSEVESNELHLLALL